MEKKRSLGVILGNLLEHYDTALFALMAPFLAPLFFEGKSSSEALFLTFGILPLGVVTKFLGAGVFGWIADRFGKRLSLCISLSGMAILSVALGLLPTSHQVGRAAPFFLAFIKALQGFFSAGETANGAIFVLERTEKKDQGWVSSLYDASSVLGGLFASGLVVFLSGYGEVSTWWRYPFWFGGVTALFGLWIRMGGAESFEKQEGASFGTEDVRNFFWIVVTSGFTYSTYYIAFSLMNGLIPLVSDVSVEAVMQVNTTLLVFDLILLLGFGFLTRRFSLEPVMLCGGLGVAFLAVPLFALMEGGSFVEMVGVRASFIFLGVAFGAPFHAWAFSKVWKRRCMVLSLGYATGAQLLGVSAPVISLWFYRQTGWTGSCGIYPAFLALVACYGVFQGFKKERFLRNEPIVD